MVPLGTRAGDGFQAFTCAYYDSDLKRSCAGSASWWLVPGPGPVRTLLPRLPGRSAQSHSLASRGPSCCRFSLQFGVEVVRTVGATGGSGVSRSESPWSCLTCRPGKCPGAGQQPREAAGAQRRGGTCRSRRAGQVRAELKAAAPVPAAEGLRVWREACRVPSRAGLQQQDLTPHVEGESNGDKSRDPDRRGVQGPLPSMHPFL